jgi:hypothetical protein
MVCAIGSATWKNAITTTEIAGANSVGPPALSLPGILHPNPVDAHFIVRWVGWATAFVTLPAMSRSVILMAGIAALQLLFR